ncbi:FecCD family ABC transporter permease [Dehalobacter restrictus]|uniref:Iron chelate uptake ABC transporter family permease subunit n=1 Tax=Dehalobacter restrictus TaxID=55583 RepID=A0A857DG11_9FIRM|nr:iron ABC transporter permease [Dehalobacter restrictus]QGZ99214.1 iron chelate uptake ABC transporter family permease subunit [Dehalobacter restrictus]
MALQSWEEQKKHGKRVLVCLMIALPVCLVLYVSLGKYYVPFRDILAAIASMWDQQADISPKIAIILNSRIARALGAILAGAALATAGAAYQGIFRNPLASPAVLGAPAGASFGAALGILLAAGDTGVQLLSFLFGLGAVLATYFISKSVGKRGDSLILLLLIGMVVSAFFTSLVALTQYLADPESQLPAITYWLMGGLTDVSFHDIRVAVIPIALGIIVLMLSRWNLNVMALGDEEALSLGVDAAKARWPVIIFATLISSAAISVCGTVGWVGLVIPHIARALVGANYRIMLPVATVMGGIYLLVMDLMARSLFAIEVPLGVVTALVGGPFFIGILLKGFLARD